MIGLETAFAAVYTHLVAPGLVPLSTVIERMSTGPARAFGLRAAGAAGRRAAPTWRSGTWSESWLVAPPYASRSRNCAFAGRRCRASAR